MEKILVTIINALGVLGEKGTHYVLNGIEAFVTKSTTEVDNTLFYKVITWIQAWTPKNPTA